MEFLYDLALQRAGYDSLLDFQRANGLYPSGEADVLTLQALEPYLLGYRSYAVQEGDTYWSLAQRFDVSAADIETANPGINPERLFPGQRITVPLGFDVVPVNVPFTYPLLQLCIRGLEARYPMLSHSDLAPTDYGRKLVALRFGTGERVASYNASHHANEWITTPLLMKYLEEYCKAWAVDESIYGIPARLLAAESTLYLIPMVNPDGVDLVTGALPQNSLEYRRAQDIASRYPAIPFPNGWKANLNGVDLNLNYPAGWDQARQIKFSQGYTQPAPRDYVGRSPLDQPETAAMAAFTEKIKPQLTISYHTQGRVIYWKYLDQEPPGARVLGERFANASGYTLSLVPSASAYAGYKDWFILNYNLPGYTVEAGYGVNPLPLTQFPDLYRDNLGIFVQGLLG